jgi:hypothetical protein
MAITRVSTSSITNPKKYVDFLADNTAFPFIGAFESIATANGTGSSGVITFSSIPQTYKSLQIRWRAKHTATLAALNQLNITINGATTNYSYHYLSNSSGAVAFGGVASTTFINTNSGNISSNAAYPNMHGVGIIDIIDYTSTTKTKTLNIVNGADINATGGTGNISVSSGLWYATPAAITSITLTSTSSNWTTSSSFALYGVK